MRMKRIIFYALILVSAVLGCVSEEEPAEVSLEKRRPLEVKEHAVEGEPVRIAVGAMITPREGFSYYRNMFDYISDKLGRPVEYIDRESYTEVNDMLKTGDLDAAFVCGGPYVDGHAEFGLELLVVPQAYGKTVYHSYTIVHIDSSIQNFRQLRGKSFAFADPKSNSGKLVPTYILSTMGDTPETFFSETTFTYAHDKSIKAVALKLVDGAAVDSLIWEYADKTDPEYTAKTRIINRSAPYGIPPVVVRPGLDAELKARLKDIFLHVHEDPRGREILTGMMIDRFVEGDDGAYESIRQMKQWIAGQRAATQ